jgi:hypothetical protein
MAWFRSHRGVITWLAFFALACQLLLSFGHVHAGNLSGASIAWAGVESGNASPDIAPSPQKNAAGFGGDFCAICANVSLANALVSPILAAILALFSFAEILPWPLATNKPRSLARLAFRARGPPHA